MFVQFSSTYNQQSFSSALTMYRFPEDYSSHQSLLVKAIRYLFQNQNNDKRAPRQEQLVNKTIELFNKQSANNEMKYLYELVDILSTYSPNTAEPFLDRLRNLEEGKNNVNNNQRNENIEAENPKTKNIYKDTQNVHDKTINKTVITASINIVDDYKMFIQKDSVFQIKKIGTSLNNSENVLEFIDYMINSFSVYGYKKQITLQEVFVAIWHYINDKTRILYKEELMIRLYEEINEMKGLCSTGHLSRLINVIQGYDTPSRYLIRIDQKMQYKAVIENYLTKKLEEAPETVRDGIIDKTREYELYIYNVVKEKLLEWKEEYGNNILVYIPHIVNKFINMEIFD